MWQCATIQNIFPVALLKFEDAHGNELYKIQEKMMRIKDSMEVEDANGNRVAMVKKALISLNLLQQSQTHPQMSAYAHLYCSLTTMLHYWCCRE